MEPGPPSHRLCPERSGFERAFSLSLTDGGGTLAAAVVSEVVVAVFDLDDWSGFLAPAAATINAEEWSRAARQRNPANRDALVLTYALHRLLLARVMGCTPGRVGIHRDAKGCPRLPDDQLHTSVSHAGQRVAFAVTAAGPVGIDIEPCMRAAGMRDLAGHVAHPGEVAALAQLGAAARERALLDLWVRKEALLKAAGIGLECAMDSFIAPEGTVLTLPGDTFSGHTVELCMPDCGAGWVMALAAPPGVRSRPMTTLRSA